MKINTIQPIVQTKQPIIKRIKNAFSKRITNLKNLMCDVFEKEKRPHYIIIDGKKFDERDLPNCVSGPSDWVGVTWSRVEFYPEDLEKMKNMTVAERIKFKRKLLEQKRYIDNDYDENK